jgi:hypothetical protein
MAEWMPHLPGTNKDLIHAEPRRRREEGGFAVRANKPMLRGDADDGSGRFAAQQTSCRLAFAQHR